jgi:hypothetical protein
MTLILSITLIFSILGFPLGHRDIHEKNHLIQHGHGVSSLRDMTFGRMYLGLPPIHLLTKEIHLVPLVFWALLVYSMQQETRKLYGYLVE